MENLKNLYNLKSQYEKALKLVDKRSAFGKKLKDTLEKIEINIFKLENPEGYESNKKVLEGFVKSGCYSSVLSDRC